MQEPWVSRLCWVAVPVIRFAPPRLQLWLGVVLVSVALLYPTLRATDFFPTMYLVDTAASVSDDRAQSLKFRFDQEQQLLDHAWKRFSFGWGRFGRNRVYDEESGRDLSVTDGQWIITMGQFGFSDSSPNSGCWHCPFSARRRHSDMLTLDMTRYFWLRFLSSSP